MLRIIIVISGILFFEDLSFSQNEYFMTLRNEKVNLRQGPSKEYPVKIFYKKKFWFLISITFDKFPKIQENI